jgi:uncharacterized protein YjiS (DUF1127 family)
MSALNGETAWAGLAARIAEALASWCKPRSSARLDQLDRHVLRDIGMSQFGIAEAPFAHRR